jgi:hypothetical protein
MTLKIHQDAAELKLRAERRAGEILAEINPRKHTGRPGKNSSHRERSFLADLGIDRNQSSCWQQEAKLPTEDFEASIRETREGTP